MKQHIRNLTKTELEAFMKLWKLPRYRAEQILHWIYQKSVTSFGQMANLPHEVRRLLEEKADLNRLQMISMNQSNNSESIKFLTKTHDDHLCETVLISQQGRSTVCVSTQLGCRIRCIFCASGKGKFGRDLTAGEIVEQASLVASKINKRITNVVFMGMGEPLDNYENTMKALEILQAKWGFALGCRRITVSTSGIAPKILSFVKATHGRIRLSVSLHSAIDKTRSYLVPINKRYPLPELTKTLETIHKKLKRDITFEYTVIDGVNDSFEEAEATAKLSRQLHAKVNLIPYNPIREMDFKTPSKSRLNEFSDILRKQGVCVTIRQTAGRDIDAACGQLRLRRD